MSNVKTVTYIETAELDWYWIFIDQKQWSQGHYVDIDPDFIEELGVGFQGAGIYNENLAGTLSMREGTLRDYGEFIRKRGYVVGDDYDDINFLVGLEDK